MDTSKELTEFDSLICDPHLQMIKAAIPYISASGQQILSIYVKSLELSKTMKLLQKDGNQSVGICSISENKRNPTEMLNAIKKYCTDGEREMLELFMNFSSAFHMYNSYRELFPSEHSGKNAGNASQEASINPMDILKGMLSPEQQSMFDTYSTLFNTAT